jgi:3-oxoacyl-[acyl-carrier-protein] synthase II
MVGLGLIAGHLALADAGIAADDTARRDVTGVALGTSTGSIRSVWEIAHSAFRPEVPYVPSRFPNSVMNSCAGQLAVWNTLKGVNATLASGHVSAVSALRYARNAIRSGQARAMLAGGAEELTPHLAWAWQRSGVLAPDAVLGEGCAILVVEHPDAAAGRPVVAELLAAETGWFGTRAPGAGPSGIARGLERLVRRALDRSGVTADDVDLVALGAGAHVGARRVEELGVRRALGGLPAVLRLSDVLGDCYSAAAALQGAAVLARWSGGDRPAESLALVTTVGADGHAGCYLLRRTPAGADGAGEVAA